MDLYIVRHGQSESNCGLTDSEDAVLTELGIRQAGLLGDALSDIKFDRILASPLCRSARTAHEIALRQKQDIKVELLPELAEVGTKPSVKWAISETQGHEQCPLAMPLQIPTVLNGNGVPVEETLDDTRNRAKKIISYLKETSDENDNILLCTHAVFNKYLFYASTGHFFEDLVSLSQHNCCVNLFRFFTDIYGRKKVRICYMNKTNHLPEEMHT